MKNISKKIVFFGSGPVASASLEFLAKHFDIETVITKSVPVHHKGSAPVEDLANNLHLPIIFASNRQELDEAVKNHQFQSQTAIIVDYGVIVSQKVIDAFDLGMVNSHFSLLPEWRGADPITFSILSGQNITGVSLMLVEPALDTGKLIAQKTLDINDDETTPGLTKRLIELSNELLLKIIPEYISGKTTPWQQPHSDQATYSRKLTKADGIIDWKKSATQIEREVRAFRDWPKSQTLIHGHKIIVTNSYVTNQQTDKLDIMCGDGSYLSIDELIAPSGRTMSAKDFVNGYNLG